MIDAAAFVDHAKKSGFGLSTSVSCAHLEPLVQACSESLEHVEAANEGDAVALCCGAHLAGTRSVAFIQNSGLGNAVNPLTSLAKAFALPMLLVISWRGEPGTSDEPQHRLMGAITDPLLDLMRIDHETIDDTEQLEAAFGRAGRAIERCAPYAFIIRRGAVLKGSGPSRPVPERRFVANHATETTADESRIDVLRAVVKSTPENEWSVIATTGYTGRELYTVEDRPNHLYMVGSMGCALPLGLGVAMGRPHRKVAVLDGDGALLMRLGAMSTAAAYGRGNLAHVLLDNAVHLSTGAQPTTSTVVDWPGLAAAAGYPRIETATSGAQVADLIENIDTDTFIYVKVSPEVPSDLPRPTIGPADVAQRLRKHLAGAKR